MRFASVVVLLFFFSCSPMLHQVSVPDSQNLARQGENCEVQFHYLGNEGNLLIFDMVVKNNSNEILYIDPDRIAMSASKDQYAAYSVSPVDPNPLSEYDVAIRLRAKIQSKGIFKALIGVASAGLGAYSGLSIGENVFGQVGKDMITTAGLFAGEIAVSSLDAKQESLKEDLQYVPNEMLAPGTLPPNQTMRGKVFFDAIPKMRFYTFQVPVEGDQFVFQFSK